MKRFPARFGLVLRVLLFVFLGLVSLRVRDAGREADYVTYESANKLLLSGHLEQAEHLAHSGYLQEQQSNPRLARRFHLLEAQAMVLRGDFSKALTIMESEPADPNDPKGNIEQLTLESVALARTQQFPIAQQKLVEAQALCDRAPLAAGGVSRARGIVAVQRGAFDDARAEFLDSLHFAKSHGDRHLEASDLLNIGAVALQQEQYDQAADWSKSAYEAAIGLGDEDIAERALGNVGWAFFELGDTQRALELFNEAEKHATALGNVLFQVQWLTTSGDAYWRIGNSAGATVAYKKALALAWKINSKEQIVNLLEDLAHTSIDAGNLDEAATYVQQLAPLVQASGNRLDILDVQFAQARLAASRHQDQQAESLFRAVEHDPASQTSMRLGAEHELARLYESQRNTRAAEKMYNTSLATFESARDQLKNEESKLPFLANATGIYDDYVHFLVEQGRNLEALAIADQSRARTLAQGLGILSNVNIERASALHPAALARRLNATLLFYWLESAHSYLWIISTKGVQLVPLPAQREMLPIISRYRKSLLGLGDPIEDGNPDGAELYRILVAPAAPLIKPESNVIILDDGPLSQLNFETTIVPGKPAHYWIEDASVVSAPSLYLLASSKPPRSFNRKLLLIGDAVSPGPDYPALPMASAEMRDIAQHFRPPEQLVLARDRATPETYIASAPQDFSYIHFVAHGIASSTDPLDSAILLSRSSTVEDSFKLHARDIMQHPIHARLVTISACYGGGTKSYAGEGSVGLAWAFLRAGAHNVIGALWEVSDTSTPRLMDDLYNGLQDGLAPSSALHQAKLNLLHTKGEFRKPFYWGALQIYTGM